MGTGYQDRFGNDELTDAPRFGGYFRTIPLLKLVLDSPQSSIPSIGSVIIATADGSNDLVRD
jgi:hypothetical protein